MKLYSADQIASMVGMHPRTIRRYIREGKLKATKVGGEWRVEERDAEAFVRGNIQELESGLNRDIVSWVEGKATEERGTEEPVQVCAVLDCFVEKERAVRLSELFVRSVNEADGSRGKARFQYIYDAGSGRARFTIWSSPLFAGELLTEAGRLLERLEKGEVQ